MNTRWLNSLWRAGVCLLMFLTAPLVSHALMIELSLADLVNRSGAIVIGRVEKTESFWKDEIIYTHVTITCTDSLLGSFKNDSLIVEVVGGEVGEIGMKVSDTPTFTVGTDVFLFLQGMGREVSSNSAAAGMPVYSVAGRAQGLFVIGANGMVQRQGFTVRNPSAAGAGDMSVNDLIGTVRQLLAEKQK